MNETQKSRSHRFAQLVGLELKANFTRHEVSQTNVADRLGHSRTSFSKWLNAKPSMPMEAVINTCELIGVDPRSIFDAAYRRLVEEMGPYNAGERGLPLDDVAADEQSAIEETLRAYQKDPMELAASHSGHKHDPDPEPGA